MLRRKQRFAGGMLISNAAALIQMMRNARVGQMKQQLRKILSKF